MQKKVNFDKKVRVNLKYPKGYPNLTHSELKVMMQAWIDAKCFYDGGEAQDVEFWASVFEIPRMKKGNKKTFSLYRAHIKKQPNQYSRYTSWSLSQIKASKYMYKNNGRQLILCEVPRDDVAVNIDYYIPYSEEFVVKPLFNHHKIVDQLSGKPLAHL